MNIYIYAYINVKNQKNIVATISIILFTIIYVHLKLDQKCYVTRRYTLFICSDYINAKEIVFCIYFF